MGMTELVSPQHPRAAGSRELPAGESAPTAQHRIPRGQILQRNSGKGQETA